MGTRLSNGCDQFFLEPSTPWLRRYEALRAVFVEDEPLRDVAARFEVSYGTLRNWASAFRAAYDQGQPSPFFSRRRAGRSATPTMTHTAPPRKTTPGHRSLTPKSCRWK